MSEKIVDVTKSELRSANIGVLVATLIAIGGAVVFRNSGEATLQLVGLAAIVGGFGVYTILDELTQRKKGRRSQ